MIKRLPNRIDSHFFLRVDVKSDRGLRFVYPKLSHDILMYTIKFQALITIVAQLLETPVPRRLIKKIPIDNIQELNW